MKRIVLSFVLTLGLFSICSAREDFNYVPKPNTYTSEAVYISTYVQPSVNAISSMAVVISSYPCILHTVNVSSASASGGTLELFNSRVSTAFPQTRIDIIYTANQSSRIYDVFLASGLAISNSSGPTFGGVNITYRER